MDAGGCAQAVCALYKSQSTLTCGVHKLEALLGVQVFALHGRKTELTTTDRLPYRRAQVPMADRDNADSGVLRVAHIPREAVACDCAAPDGCTG